MFDSAPEQPEGYELHTQVSTEISRGATLILLELVSRDFLVDVLLTIVSLGQFQSLQFLRNHWGILRPRQNDLSTFVKPRPQSYEGLDS